MAVPQVTCGPDVVIAWNEVPYALALSATATESPTSWRWDMLSVPPGSSANIGANGDFMDGIATVQNPSCTLDAGDGGYCFQCRATNGEGTSDPAVDKRSGQQLALVRTFRGQLYLPPDYGFDWGQKYINPTLLLLEAGMDDHLVLASSSDTSPSDLYSKLWAGSNITISDYTDHLEISASGGGGGETPIWEWNGYDLSQFNVVPGNELLCWYAGVVSGPGGYAWIRLQLDAAWSITDAFQRALWLVINDLYLDPYSYPYGTYIEAEIMAPLGGAPTSQTHFAQLLMNANASDYGMYALMEGYTHSIDLGGVEEDGQESWISSWDYYASPSIKHLHRSHGIWNYLPAEPEPGVMGAGLHCNFGSANYAKASSVLLRAKAEHEQSVGWTSAPSYPFFFGHGGIGAWCIGEGEGNTAIDVAFTGLRMYQNKPLPPWWGGGDE